MDKDIYKEIKMNILYIEIEMFRLDIIENIKPIVTLEDLYVWKSKLNPAKTRDETFILRINLVTSLMLNDKINIKEVKII